MVRYNAIEFDLEAVNLHALIPIFNACLAQAKSCGQYSRREMWLAHALDAIIEFEKREVTHRDKLTGPKLRRIIDGVRGKRI